MKRLIKTLQYISIFIFALSFVACEDDDIVLPKVESNFTYTTNSDTGTVTFINISENANNYEWDFGDGTSSTEINPVKTYENGTYTINLKATNVSGASDVFQNEITILIPEIASLPISFDGTNTKYDAVTFGGAAFALVTNPDSSGANTSTSQVGEITNSGATFEGFYFDLGEALDLSTLKTVKALFWSNTPISVLLKLESGTSPSVETTANHGGTGWEEILFTFSSDASYSRFTMFVDGPGTASGKFYIDDITQIETPVAMAPSTNATVPDKDAANVVSVYSDAYTNISGINYDPNWGQSGHMKVVTDFDPTGGGTDTVMFFEDFNYQGTDFSGNPQDLSSMEFLHLDIWVAEGTDRQVKISPINGGSGTGAEEVLIEVPLTPGSWNSVDLPKSSFTGMVWDDVVQIKFDGQFNGDGSANTDPFDIYVDNIYFYKSGPSSTTEPTTNAPVPSVDAANVASVYSNAYTDIAGINYDPNWSQSGHMKVVTDFNPTGSGSDTVLFYDDFNYQGTDFSGNPQDLSSMEFLHVDIWVPTGTDRQVKISPVNGGSGTGIAEVLIEVPLTPGSWNSVDLPKSSFTGMVWDDVIQIKFDGQFNGDGSANTDPFDIYVDNIYFHK